MRERLCMIGQQLSEEMCESMWSSDQRLEEMKTCQVVNHFCQTDIVHK